MAVHRTRSNPLVYLAFALKAFPGEIRESLVNTDANEFVVDYPTQSFAQEPKEVAKDKATKEID